MALVQTLRTVEDALALPDRDDCRYELDEGELIEVSLPRTRHQLIALTVSYELVQSGLLPGFALPVGDVFV